MPLAREHHATGYLHCTGCPSHANHQVNHREKTAQYEEHHLTALPACHEPHQASENAPDEAM